MNIRKTESYRSRKLAVTPLAVALTLAWGGAAHAVEYWLQTGTTTVMGVPMWGYALCGTGTTAPTTCAGSVTVPGPALTVPPGEGLVVHLHNTLAEPTSIVIPGQAMPTGPDAAILAPVKVADAQDRQRVHSFTAEATAETDQTYLWNNLKPGTYLYHSGTHPQVQVQMGLYGALTHDAASGQAYAGVPYDNQLTLLFSEIDPALHAAVDAGTYGPDGSMTSTVNYAPKYFLINGAPHTATSAPLAAGSTGQTTLLRLLNAGLQTRSPVLQGQYMRLMAEDGNKYPYAREQYSVFLPALKTVDAVFTPAAAVNYPLYDRRLAVTNPGTTGSVDGGMLAFLTVAVAEPGTPVAVADSYSAVEDTPLTVAAPGVLSNDTGTGLSAVLVSSVHNGSLSLAADGGFNYSPAANFYGNDSFSYKASNGSLSSATVTVSLSVAGVNDPPVAANNAYSVAAGATLSVAAPGVLGNDSDVDGDTLTAVLVNGPAAGTLTLNANGSFTYAAPTTAGTQSFTYQASDGTATSGTATVTLTVLANRPPVAKNDTANAPRRTTASYTPVIINVLSNDTDPDNNIDPASVTIVTPPNKGGTATVNANGTVNYTPQLNFRGSDSFSYRVRDTGNLLSNIATVKVNVK